MQMIELKTNIVDVHNPLGTATVRFTVTGRDAITDLSYTSDPQYAMFTAKVTASDDALVLLVGQSVQYGRVVDGVRARLIGSRPVPSSSSSSDTAPVAVPDEQQRQQWFQSVDDVIAAIIGQITRFQLEYIEREAAAAAYTASDYATDPTIWVTRFAEAAGLSYQESAARILSQAAAYRKALEDLGAIRMDKYRILRAPSLDAAKIEYDEIIAAALVIQRGLP